MLQINETKIRIIAFHLICKQNYKFHWNVQKQSISYQQFYNLNDLQMRSLGLLPQEVDQIRKNYKNMAEEELEKAQKDQIELVFKDEEFYPILLGKIYDPPDFIYVKGDKALLKTKMLAVVGSRKGTRYGYDCLRAILPDLLRNNITIVSGMAYGIDSMAHKIAVEENGHTIGVNAGGLDHPYPAGNRGLIVKILERGCVISEFPLGVVPRPHFFPIRNRIIAGISKSVFVAEATVRSGSLITARLGLEQNRDIFALPGRIDSHQSTGTNRWHSD